MRKEVRKNECESGDLNDAENQSLPMVSRMICRITHWHWDWLLVEKMPSLSKLPPHGGSYGQAELQAGLPRSPLTDNNYRNHPERMGADNNVQSPPRENKRGKYHWRPVKMLV
jgi:hypothetical protein